MDEFAERITGLRDRWVELRQNEYDERHLPGLHDQKAHGRHGVSGLWSLARAGGFTYSVTSHSHVTSGYALAPYPDRTVVIQSKDFKPNSIREFRDKNHDLLSKPNHYLGAWREIDPESGVDKVWLDVSIVEPDRAEAERIGREYDQVAMFDLGPGETIQLGGTGGGAARGVAAGRRERRRDRQCVCGPDGRQI